MSSSFIYSQKTAILLISHFFLSACATVAGTNANRLPSETLYVSEAITSLGLFSKSIEGPAVDVDGNLYIVNFLKKGTIGIVRSGREPELWLELPQGAVGNSIRFDKNGKMFVADYKGHRVYSIDRKTKKISVHVENPDMNQPNDIAISSEGLIYMSDPSWNKRQKGNIWVADANGQVQLGATDVVAANGIDINSEETRLYFGDSMSGSIYSYDLDHGSLTNKKIIYKFKPDTIDGLRCDVLGNIYVARITMGTVDYISPEGKLLRSIPTLGKEPNNIAFGGPDGKTLYVTMRDGGYVESFRVEAPGREWLLQQSK
ncbi:MAG: SMP-30/gluconolactonase/LRE family protein [Bdellovibrionaceae bacterium]|nr:SMP-30/gluconolactonase/LRE family protein [Pseudobdellovibrionaceae bacterium]